jgi:hypothetical protein
MQTPTHSQTGLVVALIASVPVADQAAAIGVSYLCARTLPRSRSASR